MRRKRLPRKLKKKVIKHCGREAFKQMIYNDRYSFQREVYCELTDKGYKYIDTGRYRMMFDIHDGL